MSPAADGIDLDALVEEAEAGRANAYAPYSRFTVGAAVATDRGVFRGANVENASYGLCICAERVACAAAVAAGARRVEAVAVTSSSPTPTPPCGACRQFLYEFGPGITVVSQGREGERTVWRLEDLLAHGFGPDDLRGGTSAAG